MADKKQESVQEPAAKEGKEKMVKIRLFKDNERYKDDVFVAINGRAYQIKRGEDVEVPAGVAEVLEQSQRQDEATAAMLEQESARFSAQARALNV